LFDTLNETLGSFMHTFQRMHRFEAVQASILLLPGEEEAGEAGGTPVPAFRSLASAN
jgi:hypothetical protein